MSEEFNIFSKSFIDSEALDSDAKSYLKEEFDSDLPKGWRKIFVNGKIYYLNNNTKRHYIKHPRHDEIVNYLQAIKAKKEIEKSQRHIAESLNYNINQLRILRNTNDSFIQKNNSDSALGDEYVNITPEEDKRSNSSYVDSANLPQVGHSPSHIMELNTIQENPTKFLSNNDINSWLSRSSHREFFFEQKNKMKKKIEKCSKLIDETKSEIELVSRAINSFESFSTTFLDSTIRSQKSQLSKNSTQSIIRRSNSCSRNSTISSPARECFKNHPSNIKNRRQSNIVREDRLGTHLVDSFDRSLLNPSTNNVRRHSTLARPKPRDSILNETPVLFDKN